jgi:hypothetical protein
VIHFPRNISRGVAPRRASRGMRLLWSSRYFSTARITCSSVSSDEFPRSDSTGVIGNLPSKNVARKIVDNGTDVYFRSIFQTQEALIQVPVLVGHGGSNSNFRFWRMNRAHGLRSPCSRMMRCQTEKEATTAPVRFAYRASEQMLKWMYSLEVTRSLITALSFEVIFVGVSLGHEL